MISRARLQRRPILKNNIVTMNKLVRLLTIVLFGCISASCTPDLTDSSPFSLHYYDAEVVIGSNVVLNPTYHGAKPSDFKIYGITRNGVIFYDPRLDGEILESDPFFIKSADGTLIVSNTSDLKSGIYRISLSCRAGGDSYEYPELVTIKMMEE